MTPIAQGFCLSFLVAAFAMVQNFRADLVGRWSTLGSLRRGGDTISCNVCTIPTTPSPTRSLDILITTRIA
jgi:hypothetical protein